MSNPMPAPFQLHVPDSAISDLRERLSRTQLPDEPMSEPWTTGAGVAFMQRLIDYWANGFDWRMQEAMLNRFRQFKAPMADIEVHFIHEEGRGAR